MIVILSIITVILDQMSKMAAIKFLKGKRPYEIISNFFQFYYVENRGAAFGILQHKRMFFVIITLLIVIILSFYSIKYYNRLNKLTLVSFGLLIGGAIGNLIDRIRLGYVVDFISFKLFFGYNFPVFNIADIAIVVSTIIITILIILDKIEI